MHQEKALLLLLSIGALDESEFSAFLNLDLAHIRTTCETLEKAGYARKVSGIGQRWAAVYPFKALTVENEKVVSQMQEIGTEIDTFTKERFKKLEEIVTTTEAQIVASINKGKEQATKTKVDTFSNLEVLVKTEKEKFPEHKKKGEEEVGTIFEKQTAEEKKAFEVFVEAVDKKTTENENSILSTLKQNSDNITTQSEALIPENKTRMADFKQKSDEIGTNYTTTAKNFVDKATEGLEKEKTTLFSSVDSFNEQSVQSGNEFCETLKNEKQRIVDESKTKTSEIVEDFHNKVAQKNAAFSESVKSISAEKVVQGKEKIQESKTSFETDVQETRNQATSLLSQLSTDTEHLVKEFLDKAQELSSSFQTKVQTTVSEAEKQFNEIFDRSLTIVGTLESSTTGYLDEVEVSLKESIGATVSENMNFIGDTKTSVVNELHNTLKSADDKINEQVVAFSGKITTSFNETTTKAKEFSQNYSTNTSTELSELFTELNSAVEDNKSHVETVMNEETAMFEKYIQDLVKLITTSSTTMSELVSSEYNGWRSEAAKVSEDTRLKSSITRSNARSETSLAFGKVIKDGEGTIDSSMKAVTTSFEKIESETHLALDEAQGSVKGGIAKEIDDLKGGIAGFSNQFSDSAKSIRESLEGFDKEVTSLGEKVTKTKLPAYNSVPIIGSKAVLEYMSQMFDRIKSGITILVPDPKDIPVDKIEKSKTTQRITIVTQATPETHESLLKQLLKKPNVRVRNLALAGGGKEMHVAVAADRDGEEVLLSAQHRDDSIGFASTTEGYIKLFGKLVIGDYFLAQSKEVKRADLGL